MNCQFITGNLHQNLFRKVILAALIILFSDSIKSQEMIPDSIQIIKEWNDKNGKNVLSVKVNALCNPDKPPYDGHPTMIIASLQNNNYKIDTLYSEEHYEMKMILFHEEDILYYNLNGVKAVFIPFFFCSNADSEKTVSYIVFYNKNKYLLHLKYNCSENGDCKLTDKLNDLTKEIFPAKLRNEFFRQVKSKYNTTKDFYDEKDT